MFRCAAGAFIERERANVLLDAFRAEVLNEAADALVSSETHPGCPGCKGGVQFAEAKIRRVASPNPEEAQ